MQKTEEIFLELITEAEKLFVDSGLKDRGWGLSLCATPMHRERP